MANRVLAGDDISDCYEMQVEPTMIHARMLLSRAARIWETFIPELEGIPQFGSSR